MSRAPRLAALALAAALGLPGCVISAQRALPQDWPARLEGAAGGCPEVSGRWEARAAEDPYTWERKELVGLLGAAKAAPDPKRGPADWVDLAQPDADTLVVRSGLAGEGGGEAVTLRRGRDFACRKGALLVARKSEWGSTGFCVVRDWGETAIWRDARGALIARRAESGFCVGLLANVVSWTTEWDRFRRAAPWP